VGMKMQIDSPRLHQIITRTHKGACYYFMKRGEIESTKMQYIGGVSL
jgi:hypothetical protein